MKNKGNIICAGCTGYLEYEHPFMDKDFVWQTKTIKRPLKISTIVISVDYELYYIKYCECMIGIIYKEHDLAKDIINAKGEDIVKFRNEPPLYEDGDTWVYEICYILETAYNRWIYCKKTSLDKIVNIWNKSELRIAASNGNEGGGFYLQKENIKHLKMCEFVGKLSNPYEVSMSDINYLTNKLNKNITIK